mgnify:CR=1 FL=1
MLPKFLIADNSQEALDLVYVVHTEKPRCIIQCGLDGFYSNQRIYWIDEEPLSQDDIDTLMEEAEEFYEDELANQEDVYDEDDEEEDLPLKKSRQ